MVPVRRLVGDNSSLEQLHDPRNMTLKVKFFASLRESVGCREVVVDSDRAATVEDAWRIATGGRPVPDNLVVAVNLEYARCEAPVQAGDEVAFFPPVTGG